MKKRCYRYFGGFLKAQQAWLNNMASRGWRLVRTRTLLYEFEPCNPGQYCYCVDFVGQMSYAKSKDYRQFLQGLGCRTFYKNLNLNWSVGHVRWRPWAKGTGQIATSPGGFNRELIIAEKQNDGTPFALHTTCDDQIAAMRPLRAAWLSIAAVFSGLGLWSCVSEPERPAVWAVLMGLGLLSLIPAAVYWRKMARCARQPYQ